ncbi:hypothetical protein TNCV_1895471 [Trichonephila clavipes]|nr:hypothetical protein TNCV_1895471 [Trichonephila clavipes]
MIIKFEETGKLAELPGRERKSVGVETAQESLLLRLTEPPVSSILQQGVDQCYASWRFRGRQYEKFGDTF